MRKLALLFFVFSIQLCAQEELMRDVVSRYMTDRAAIERRWNIPLSKKAHQRRTTFIDNWEKKTTQFDFKSLSQESQIDARLLINRIEKDKAQLQLQAKRHAEMASIVKFAPPLVALLEAQRDMQDPDDQKIAKTLNEAIKQLAAIRNDLSEANTEPAVAYRAAKSLTSLRRSLRSWYRFRDDYDPMFTWWVKRPFESLNSKLQSFIGFLRTDIVGVGATETDALIGDPIGQDALRVALRAEFIPYSPKELIAIAEREFAFCEKEQIRAARELGLGDNWLAAQESVKDKYVKPGEQPKLIRDLANEAIKYVKDNDLVTVPPLCEEIWRMDMMSPQRQRVTPYFTGGEVVSVAFPVSDMDHDEKLMTLRGNNRHFSRAVVHHELIPGHQLQQFMRSRHRPWRSAFNTPFWVEGWALYWEMLLWDRGFGKTPEDRLGMLFWRKHRCARIIFSLSFHLGIKTADECVDLLVERVGHERKNARAEVRRSIIGTYPPLYQAAYMLGGLQIKSLHNEFVKTNKMKDREFHDLILKQNAIPIEMIRAVLLKTEIGRDFQTTWRF